MRKIFRKGNYGCYLLVVRFNEVLKSAGTVKFRGFDNFSKCKSRERGCR